MHISTSRARTAGVFYKIRHYAPQDTLMLLYHTIFAPFLAYDEVSVWGLTYPSMLDSISALQKKILRIVTFSDQTAPSSPIFYCLQVLKLSDIIILYIVSFVFECVHNLAPTYWSVGPRRPSDESDAIVAGYLYMYLAGYLAIWVYFYVSS